MQTVIENVRPGDTIIEGRERTVVQKIDVYACSSKGTHINDKVCYDRGWVVQVKQVTNEEDGE